MARSRSQWNEGRASRGSKKSAVMDPLGSDDDSDYDSDEGGENTASSKEEGRTGRGKISAAQWSIIVSVD
jgi:hypothetical protein